MLWGLKRLFGGARRSDAFVIVTLNVGLMPFGLWDHVADPLGAALRYAKPGPNGT